VIGIGAGPDVDGQILVLQDILNISPQVTLGRKPRFVKDFMRGCPDIESALRNYVQAVKAASYPGPEHCFAEAASLPGAQGHATPALPGKVADPVPRK
jgi:3-methyl-2-oxobutanoate hydroxymethyltransferase